MSMNDTCYILSLCGDPVDNPEIRQNSNRVVGYYGFVRDSGETRHSGYDYIAPKGTPVKAVRIGEIEQIRIGKYVKGKPYVCKQTELFTNSPDKTNIFFDENICKGCTNHKDCYGIQVWLRLTNYMDGTYYAYYAHLSKFNETSFKNLIFEKMDSITFRPLKKSTISRGSTIGESGSTGNAFAMPQNEQHLHFECRKGNGRNIPERGSDISPNKIVKTGFFFKNDQGTICDKMEKEDKQNLDSNEMKIEQLKKEEQALSQIKEPSFTETIKLQSITGQILWKKRDYQIFKINQLHLM